MDQIGTGLSAFLLVVLITRLHLSLSASERPSAVWRTLTPQPEWVLLLDIKHCFRIYSCIKKYDSKCMLLSRHPMKHVSTCIPDVSFSTCFWFMQFSVFVYVTVASKYRSEKPPPAKALLAVQGRAGTRKPLVSPDSSSDDEWMPPTGECQLLAKHSSYEYTGRRHSIPASTGL